VIYRRSYEEPIIDSSRICYQLLRLGAGVLGMMKPFSLSLSLSSSFSRSSLLSLSSRLCSSPLVWPPRVAGDQREWLSRIPVPLRRTDRAGSVCKTERQAHRFPDRRSPTRCRFWRSAGKDPNSMQLLPARYLGEGGSRECAATHYNAWRRFSLSMSRHSARRRFALQRRVKR